MVQKMAYQNQLLSTQTSPVESTRSCPHLPLLAAVLVRRRETDTLPPAEPPQVEMCLSPLLWSETFGLLVDG